MLTHQARGIEIWDDIEIADTIFSMIQVLKNSSSGQHLNRFQEI